MARPSYRIDSVRDTSTATVKRYAVNVVLTDPNASRDAIHRVVSDAVVAVGNGKPVHATSQAERRWKRTKPAIVFVFVYPTTGTIAETAWACRTLWYSPLLERDLRPLPLGGDERDGTLELDWGD